MFQATLLNICHVPYLIVKSSHLVAALLSWTLKIFADYLLLLDLSFCGENRLTFCWSVRKNNLNYHIKASAFFWALYAVTHRDCMSFLTTGTQIIPFGWLSIHILACLTLWWLHNFSMNEAGLGKVRETTLRLLVALRVWMEMGQPALNLPNLFLAVLNLVTRCYLGWIKYFELVSFHFHFCIFPVYSPSWLIVYLWTFRL